MLNTNFGQFTLPVTTSRSAGRHRRHALANEVIVRAIRSVEIHAELETSRLLRGDGKSPDGATLDPWHTGRYLVWDFTCPTPWLRRTLDNLPLRRDQRLLTQKPSEI